MLLNIKEMLKLFDGQLKVIAGHKGLDRKVSTVTVIDAPDFYNWIKGNEFIISTAYVIKDDIYNLSKLLDILNKNNAAGLGIKVDRYIKEIPEEIKRKAERLNFPIIYIPNEFAFTDIINPVLSDVVNRQAKRLSYSEKVHESFTKLVLEDEDFSIIINSLEKLINNEVIFYDKFFEKIYNSTGEIKNKDKKKELLLNNFTYELSYNGRIYGYIILTGEKSDFNLKEYDKIALEHAATVLRLKIQREISNYQVELRFRNEFIQDLIFNNFNLDSEITERSANYNWTYNNDILCLVTKINCRNKLEKARELERELDIEFSNSIFTQIANRFIYLVETKSKNKKLNRNIKNTVRQIFKNNLQDEDYFLGVGNPKTNIRDIHISYKEAKKALDLGLNIENKEKIYFFDELGVYRLLDVIYKKDIAKEFLKENLGKLISYDNKANDNLLITLETIIENNWNLRKSSQDLFIHYNTAKYRFSKICKILDFDPDDWNQKLNLAISIKLLKMDI